MATWQSLKLEYLSYMQHAWQDFLFHLISHTFTGYFWSSAAVLKPVEVDILWGGGALWQVSKLLVAKNGGFTVKINFLPMIKVLLKPKYQAL